MGCHRLKKSIDVDLAPAARECDVLLGRNILCCSGVISWSRKKITP